MSNRFMQGKFRPLNPRKYVGDVDNCVYRSSWELIACRFCDNTPEILQWSSEEIVIPYISPVDGKTHRYFTDLFVLAKQHDGSIKKYIIEIKPDSETRPPKKGNGPKSEQTYLTAVKTWAVNKAKWAYAKEWCRLNGYEFKIWTEKTLFPSQGKYNHKKRK